MVMDDFHSQLREQKKKEHSQRNQARSLHATYKNDDAADVVEAKRKKEEERKKQQEARELYSKYQGKVSEDDLKLKKLKEEERRKRRESQEEQHKFQNNDVEVKKTDSRHKRSAIPENAPPVEKKSDEQVQIQPGMVKSAKDVFSSNSDFDPASFSPNPKSPRANGAANASENSSSSHEAFVDNSPSLPYQEHVPKENTNNGVPTTMTTKDTSHGQDAMGDEKKLEEQEQDNHTLDDKPSLTTPDLSATTPTVASANIAPANADVLPPEKHQDETTAAADATATTTTVSATTTDNAAPSEAQEEEQLEQQQQQQEEPETTKQFKIRLDVLFSFGLLTSSEQPFLDHYMYAVEHVVKETIAEHQLSGTIFGQNCKFDPSFGPFVQEYTKDENYKDKRAHVQRIVVIAAIPVFITTDVSIQGARQGVCRGLQKAMQNGEFIAIAKKNQKLASK